MSELLVPLALSSQLDVTGEERIHAAKYTANTRPSYVPTNYIADVGAFYSLSSTGSTITTLSSAAPTNATDVAADGTATYIAYALNAAPYLTIYKRSGGVFTELDTAVDTAPTVSMDTVSLSSDGNYLVMADAATASSAAWSWYKRTGDTFAKLPNPTTIVGPISATNGDDCTAKWSKNGTYLAVVQRTTGTAGHNTLFVYKRTGDTLALLSVDTQPAVSYDSEPVFTPDEAYLLVAATTQAGLQTSTPIHVYSTGASITHVSSLTLTGGSVTGLTTNSTGTQVLASRWYGGFSVMSLAAGVLTLLTAQTPLAYPDIGAGLAFTPDDAFLVQHVRSFDTGSTVKRVYSVAGTTYTLVSASTPSYTTGYPLVIGQE